MGGHDAGPRGTCGSSAHPSPPGQTPASGHRRAPLARLGGRRVAVEAHWPAENPRPAARARPTSSRPRPPSETDFGFGGAQIVHCIRGRFIAGSDGRKDGGAIRLSGCREGPARLTGTEQAEARQNLRRSARGSGSRRRRKRTASPALPPATPTTVARKAAPEFRPKRLIATATASSKQVRGSDQRAGCRDPVRHVPGPGGRRRPARR